MLVEPSLPARGIYALNLKIDGISPIFTDIELHTCGPGGFINIVSIDFNIYLQTFPRTSK